MIDTYPQEESHTLKRQIGESEEYYNRRLIDPLEVMGASDEFRDELCGLAEQAYKSAEKRGNASEAIEAATDFAYRSMGVRPLEDTKTAAHLGRTWANKELEENSSLEPHQKLRLEMRKLDLVSVANMATFAGAQANNNPTAKKNLESALDASRVTIVKKGIDLLKMYQVEHEQIQDEGKQFELRGTMFELMYMTFRRNHIIQEDEYNSPSILGATHFEDSAATHFPDRNHNYDTIVMKPDGSISEVIQCKSGRSNKVYERPIRVVNGRSFERFMQNPEPFITAMTELASNDPTVSEKRMKQQNALLIGLFAEHVPELV